MSRSANLSLPYSSYFGFEENFDEPQTEKWMAKNWNLTLLFSAIYVVIIFGGKYIMKDRIKLDLRLLLCVWSGILGIFSVVGAIRTLPALVYVLRNYGFEYSMCNTDLFAHPHTAFWMTAFCLSKAWELGDTVFIVLKKNPLIFLHWYHHITVMIYCWYFYQYRPSNALWFMAMNFIVHGIMYPYYTLRAMRIPVPKQVNMVITSLQIAQMVMGLVIGAWTFNVKRQGGTCHVTDENVLYTILMYSSYFALFCHFFYNTYLAPKKNIPSKECNNNAVSNGVAKKIE